MKKSIVFIVFIGFVLMFSGCREDVPLDIAELNNVGVTRVGDGYVKGVKIARGINVDTVYFPSDANGNILSQNAYPSTSISGKVVSNTGGPLNMATVATKTKKMFVFECEQLSQCEEELKIVKKSTSKSGN